MRKRKPFIVEPGEEPDADRQRRFPAEAPKPWRKKVPSPNPKPIEIPQPLRPAAGFLFYKLIIRSVFKRENTPQGAF